jgi:hypothetical protein
MGKFYHYSKSGFKVCILIILLAAIKPETLFSQEFYPASPYGGKQQLKDFYYEHMVYPGNELISGKQGDVALAFDIDIEGHTSQLRVLQTVNTAIDKEAIRLFRLLLWEPAKFRGKPVADHQEITIPFNIKHYHKNCRLRGFDTISYPYLPVDTSFKVYLYKQTAKIPVPVFDKKNVTFQSFMQENFHYPDLAFKQNITGIVNVKFVVETSGLISNVCTNDHLGAGCTEEAIRLVKLIHWLPGVVDGKAVRVMMSLSVTYSLDGRNKFEYQPNQASNSMN